MAPWARASQLGRYLACPGASILEQVVEVSERRDDAAAWGNALHYWKETGELPSDLPPRRRKALEARLDVLAEFGKTRESMYPARGVHEVAIAVNVVDPGFPQEHWSDQWGLSRDEWKMAHDNRFVVGTIDYVGVIPHFEAEGVGDWWVDDLKTGTWDIPDDPLDSAQLMFYSAAQALWGQGPVYVSLTHWPRSPAGNPPDRRWGSQIVTVDMATQFMLEVRQARRIALSKGAESTRVGPQCSFCPSQHVCPQYAVEEEDDPFHD